LGLGWPCFGHLLSSVRIRQEMNVKILGVLQQQATFEALQRIVSVVAVAVLKVQGGVHEGNLAGVTHVTT